jgi:hypothetical protein
MSVTARLSSAKVLERVNQEVEESMRPNREIENRVAVLMVVTKTLLLSPLRGCRRRCRRQILLFGLSRNPL